MYLYGWEGAFFDEGSRTYNPFYTEHKIGDIMAKKNEGGGFSQSAGLMRYFDSEDTDKALKISPKGVIAFAIVVIVVVSLLTIFVPVN